MDEFDDSSNSSTEKRKKRPLRNRENDTPKNGLSRKTSETKLFGLSLGGDLRERCDQGTQTVAKKEFENSTKPAEKPVGKLEREKIVEEAKKDAKVESEKELDTERQRHKVGINDTRF